MHVRYVRSSRNRAAGGPGILLFWTRTEEDGVAINS